MGERGIIIKNMRDKSKKDCGIVTTKKQYTIYERGFKMARAPKSPSSPSHSLEQSMNMTMKLFDAYGNAQFGATQIATAAGLSVSSGAFKGWLSDLKQYGLLEKVDRSSYVVTQRFKDYLLVEDSEPAKAKSMRLEYVDTPPFFEQLLSSLNGKLPELRNLTSLLITQHGFNKTKASATARAFSESLQWAGALDSKRNIILAKQEARAGADEANGLHSFSDNQQEETVMAPFPASPFSAGSAANDLTMQIPLRDGRIATINYPADLTSDEAEKLSQVLQALTIGNGE